MRAALLNMCADLFHYLIQDRRHSQEISHTDIILKNIMSSEDTFHKTT